MVLLFRFGISWWILTASGIIGMTSFSYLFIGSLFTGSLRRITFRYSPGGSVALLFDEGNGD